MIPANTSFNERLYRVLNENMQLDWQSQVPNQSIPQQEVQEELTHNNPDVQYIFDLCKSIKEKLDLLQEAASREELQDYAESQIKTVITDLIGIETKITDDTTCINAISDMLNNLPSGGNGQNLKMMNGLITL